RQRLRRLRAGFERLVRRRVPAMKVLAQLLAVDIRSDLVFRGDRKVQLVPVQQFAERVGVAYVEGELERREALIEFDHQVRQADFSKAAGYAEAQKPGQRVTALQPQRHLSVDLQKLVCIDQQ